MPCYEYTCIKCGHEFEHIVTVARRNAQDCPKCGYFSRMRVSIPCMQPDSYWSGHVDATFGYVTSKKELREKEKRAGLRRSDPGDRASARLAKADREHKEDVVRNRVVNETVRDILA